MHGYLGHEGLPPSELAAIGSAGSISQPTRAGSGTSSGPTRPARGRYAPIHRTPDRRAVRSLLDAVAPGGTLLVVSHDLEPMRVPVDTSRHSRPFDPDADVRLEDVAAAIADTSAWEIEAHDTRPRPPGAASASHHVDDAVLRARRRTG